MQCDCDDTIDDPNVPSKICKKHFAWVERLVLLEREECAKVVEDHHAGMWMQSTQVYGTCAREDVAKAIRTRTETAT